MLPTLRLREFLSHSHRFFHLSKAMLGVIVVPALSDNFMYLLVDQKSRDCAVVDPVEPEKVLAEVKKHNLNLSTVLTTHHHWDHAGGNEKLAEKMNHLKIFGGDDRIGALNIKVSDGSTFTIGNYEGKCIFTPCHTSGHICYFIADEQNKYVFTGDTLFIGGCGRFFEGTAAQMYEALIEKLGSLPDETKVYCGHEYTVQNFTYGLHAEPHNLHIQKQLEIAKKATSEGNHSVPSTIGQEKLTNVFMRVGQSSILDHAKTNDPLKAMQFLREEKNNFRP